MWLLAVTLPMFLSGCGVPAPEPVKAAPAWRPVCPTATPAALHAVIAGELERSIRAGVPPDRLAVEWERLNAAARICRNGR